MNILVHFSNPIQQKKLKALNFFVQIQSDTNVFDPDSESQNLNDEGF